MLTRIAPLLASASLALAPFAASAQGVSLSFGAALTSNYVSDGVSLSNNNPAFQPYVEADLGGFYLGIWASTVRDGTDDYEIDLYAGYRTELPGGVSVDLGAARYFLNNSGASNEILLTVGVPVVPSVGLELFAGYDPGAGNARGSISASYAFNDNLGLSAAFGRNQANVNTFWNVGATYALSDNFSIDLRHHDTSNTGPLTVLTLSLDF